MVIGHEELTRTEFDKDTNRFNNITANMGDDEFKWDRWYLLDYLPLIMANPKGADYV